MQMQDFIDYYENKHVQLICSLAPTPSLHLPVLIRHPAQCTCVCRKPNTLNMAFLLHCWRFRILLLLLFCQLLEADGPVN